jgi:hypothetical protein
MTVAEWIEKLKQFPQDKEVKITDGHKYHFYEGDFDFQLYLTLTDEEYDAMFPVEEGDY